MPQCPVTGFCHLHTLLAAAPSGQACHLAQSLPAPQASPGSGTARSAVPPFLSGATSLFIPAPSSALAPSPHTAAPLRPCPLPLVLGNCPHQPTALWPSTAAAQSQANPAPPPCLPTSVVPPGRPAALGSMAYSGILTSPCLLSDLMGHCPPVLQAPQHPRPSPLTQPPLRLAESTSPALPATPLLKISPPLP